MKRLALLLPVLIASTAWAAPARFVFQVPPGWTNLSDDAPEAEKAKASPAVLENVRQNHFAFFAADLAHADDGFMENVNALIEPGTARIDMAFMHQLGESIASEAKKSGSSHHVIELGLAKAGGITVGRYVAELGAPPNTVKQIGYILPGRAQHAIVTYSTTPAEFAHYQPIFDQAAQATLGVEEPPLIQWQSIVAAGVALVLVVGYSILAKRRATS